MRNTFGPLQTANHCNPEIFTSNAFPITNVHGGLKHEKHFCVSQ